MFEPETTTTLHYTTSPEYAPKADPDAAADPFFMTLRTVLHEAAPGREAILARAAGSLAGHQALLQSRDRMLVGGKTVTELAGKSTETLVGHRSSADGMVQHAADLKASAEHFRAMFSEKKDDSDAASAALHGFFMWAETVQTDASRLAETVTDRGATLDTLVHNDFPKSNAELQTWEDKKTEIARRLKIAENLTSFGKDQPPTAGMQELVDGLREQFSHAESQQDVSHAELSQLLITITEVCEQYDRASAELLALEARFNDEKEVKIATLQEVVEAYRQHILGVLRDYDSFAHQALNGVAALLAGFSGSVVASQEQIAKPPAANEVPVVTTTGFRAGYGVTYPYVVTTAKERRQGNEV